MFSREMGCRQWSNLLIGYTQVNMKHSQLKCVSGIGGTFALPDLSADTTASCNNCKGLQLPANVEPIELLLLL